MCVNNNLVCVNNNNFLNLYSYELQISLIYTVTNRSLNFGRERERGPCWRGSSYDLNVNNNILVHLPTSYISL